MTIIKYDINGQERRLGDLAKRKYNIVDKSQQAASGRWGGKLQLRGKGD